MSAETPETAPALADYLDLFEALAGLGVEFVVIGGCAVGAYARLLGETIVSHDLDVLVTQRALESVVADSASLELSVRKLPSPRSVPVAVLDWRGHEINLLTGTTGLAPADVEARTAREFRLEPRPSLAVLVVDPFDLLRNKLAVNRPKDQPHIAVLRRFIDEEVVNAFEVETEPRARIHPAERLLEVVAATTLDESLARRLLPLARTQADFRFLAHRCPPSLLADVVARATAAGLPDTVERIARSRGLPSTK